MLASIAERERFRPKVKYPLRHPQGVPAVFVPDAGGGGELSVLSQQGKSDRNENETYYIFIINILNKTKNSMRNRFR